MKKPDQPDGPVAIVLLGDQPAVRSMQSVGCRQGADLKEPSSADHRSLGCEATALTISEQQAPSSELLAKHPINSKAPQLPPPAVARLRRVDDGSPTRRRSASDTEAAECHGPSVRRSGCQRQAESGDHDGLQDPGVVRDSVRPLLGTARRSGESSRPKARERKSSFRMLAAA